MRVIFILFKIDARYGRFSFEIYVRYKDSLCWRKRMGNTFGLTNENLNEFIRVFI